jgi:hypothetical protein
MGIVKKPYGPRDENKHPLQFQLAARVREVISICPFAIGILQTRFVIPPPPGGTSIDPISTLPSEASKDLFGKIELL